MVPEAPFVGSLVFVVARSYLYSMNIGYLRHVRGSQSLRPEIGKICLLENELLKPTACNGTHTRVAGGDHVWR